MPSKNTRLISSLPIWFSVNFLLLDPILIDIIFKTKQVIIKLADINFEFIPYLFSKLFKKPLILP